MALSKPLCGLITCSNDSHIPISYINTVTVLKSSGIRSQASRSQMPEDSETPAAGRNTRREAGTSGDISKISSSLLFR